MPQHTPAERRKTGTTTKVIKRKRPTSIFTAMKNVAATAKANSRKRK